MNRRMFAASVLLALALSAAASAQTPEQRTFTFTYAFTVRSPHAGKKLRIWFPLAQSDKYQAVKVISATGDLPLKRTLAGEDGNRMFYAETPAADQPEYKFQVVYEATRHERLGLVEAKAQDRGARRPAGLTRYLQPDKLVPTTGRLAKIAAEQTAGKNTPLEKARALYDYVFENMKYDKSGTGWGRGDAEWACDSHHGNCTDFHSLFASLARSQGIPTRFAIGFGLPTDKHEGEIPGYHCWSDFWIDGMGWIPIDISEASKHPEKREYFFGAHDANRIQFSVGRDLTLSPKQDGAPRNFLVYPYVESDGQEFPNVSNAFSFRDTTELHRAAVMAP